MINQRLTYVASGLGAAVSFDLHVCGVAALLALYEVCEVPGGNVAAWKTATLCLMLPAAVRWAVAQYALTGKVEDPLTKNYIRAFIKPSHLFWEFNNVFLSRNEKNVAAALMIFGVAFDVLLGVFGMGAIWGASQALGLRDNASKLFSNLTISGYFLSGLRYLLCYRNAYDRRNYPSIKRATAFQAFEVGLCSLTDVAAYFKDDELPSTRVDPSELNWVLLDSKPVRANLSECQHAALYVGLILNLTVRGCLEILGGTAAVWGVTGAANLRSERSLVDGGVAPAIGVAFSSMIALKFVMTAFCKLTSSECCTKINMSTAQLVDNFDKPFVLFAKAITSFLVNDDSSLVSQLPEGTL